MDQRPSTISELEADLQQALASLREIDERGELPSELKPLLLLTPPDGASVHVSLRQRESGRQLRPTGPMQSWSPRACGAWVVYELAQGLSASQPRTSEGSGDPLQDFVAALDHVERDPHLHFVSLKWFRDTYLPKRGYDWANDPDLPRQMVHEAAAAEMILTSKVPNPKTPEFPVTTIRLNREHPKVRRILESLAPKISASAPEPEHANASAESSPSTPAAPRSRRRASPDESSSEDRG